MQNPQLKEPIQIALESLREGGCVVITDDTDRENESDLVCSGELVTGELINYFITKGKGLVCVAMDLKRLEALRLPQMVLENEDHWGTRFTISVDHKDVKTGISAHERAKTIRSLADEKCGYEEFRRPGHIFPLEGRRGGVLQRLGHTESSIDLLKIAGMFPVSVICEILGEDGHMLRGEEVKKFCKQENVPQVTVQQILEYRLTNEDLLEEIRREKTEVGVEIWYRDKSEGTEHALYLQNGWKKAKETDRIPLFLIRWQNEPASKAVLEEHPVVALMGGCPEIFWGERNGLWRENIQRCFVQKVKKEIG